MNSSGVSIGFSLLIGSKALTPRIISAIPCSSSFDCSSFLAIFFISCVHRIISYLRAAWRVTWSSEKNWENSNSGIHMLDQCCLYMCWKSQCSSVGISLGPVGSGNRNRLSLINVSIWGVTSIEIFSACQFDNCPYQVPFSIQKLSYLLFVSNNSRSSSRSLLILNLHWPQ